MTTHIWLRAESKPLEERSALSPAGAKALLDAGFKVTVERSEQSIFPIEQYQEIGADIADEGSWVSAPTSAIILGLKELPEALFPLEHKHIYFAHAYKEQSGWQDILSRFTRGGGELFDLEYLVDENQRRIAAFGYWAGFAGAALAVKAWANQQSNARSPALSPVTAYADKSLLINELADLLAPIATKPKLMVIGAKGRSGSGAADLAKSLGLETIEWDMAETAKGGPFKEVIEADIFVNCVLVNQDLPPFITEELLASADRQLSVIADVSCDPYGSYNPVPVYNECTTFDAPCLRLNDEKLLDLIAIDHLPSLLPKESSEDYGAQLLPHLLTLDDLTQGVWARAFNVFQEKTAEI